jgi:hypothetical protein
LLGWQTSGSKDNKTTPVQKKSSSSTPGPDGIGYRIYKNCAITREALIIVINLVLEEQIVPLCWKTGSITLVYKKGDAKDPTNFRRICLSNTASKLFTSYLQNHIDHHLSNSHQLRKASETTSVDAWNINFSYQNWSKMHGKTANKDLWSS